MENTSNEALNNLTAEQFKACLDKALPAVYSNLTWDPICLLTHLFLFPKIPSMPFLLASNVRAVAAAVSRLVSVMFWPRTLQLLRLRFSESDPEVTSKIDIKPQ